MWSLLLPDERQYSIGWGQIHPRIANFSKLFESAPATAGFGIPEFSGISKGRAHRLARPFGLSTPNPHERSNCGTQYTGN